MTYLQGRGGVRGRRRVALPRGDARRAGRLRRAVVVQRVVHPGYHVGLAVVAAAVAGGLEGEGRRREKRERARVGWGTAREGRRTCIGRVSPRRGTDCAQRNDGLHVV